VNPRGALVHLFPGASLRVRGHGAMDSLVGGSWFDELAWLRVRGVHHLLITLPGSRAVPLPVWGHAIPDRQEPEGGGQVDGRSPGSSSCGRQTSAGLLSA
jgi:hypothetical protein